MKEVKEWNGSNFKKSRQRCMVAYICPNLFNRQHTVVAINENAANIDCYQHCAEIEDKDKEKIIFEEKLNKTIEACLEAYNRAEMVLGEITLLIQKKYPSLEATMNGDGIIFIDNTSPSDEYYSLADIKERYKN